MAEPLRRALAPAVVSLQLEHLWLYIVAPALGAVAAVAVCRCVQPPGCCGPETLRATR